MSWDGRLRGVWEITSIFVLLVILRLLPIQHRRVLRYRLIRGPCVLIHASRYNQTCHSELQRISLLVQVRRPDFSYVDRCNVGGCCAGAPRIRPIDRRTGRSRCRRQRSSYAALPVRQLSQTTRFRADSWYTAVEPLA